MQVLGTPRSVRDQEGRDRSLCEHQDVLLVCDLHDQIRREADHSKVLKGSRMTPMIGSMSGPPARSNRVGLWFLTAPLLGAVGFLGGVIGAPRGRISLPGLVREDNPLAGVSSVSPTGDTGLPFPVAPTKCRKLITKLFE